ncbi:hypothetical protein TNCV_1629671 [Trichonephila clavipes]|uniref:Uncharacterized protein n=1 Tax=Trichonephila clavipes TaxID=2585209 RepID=A0A8X7BHU6_TRICX|nr:hypothetical protein TNCV_1629671 [Trichonephila clavipes]
MESIGTKSHVWESSLRFLRIETDVLSPTFVQSLRCWIALRLSHNIHISSGDVIVLMIRRASSMAINSDLKTEQSPNS